jgi:hypothetical protein
VSAYPHRVTPVTITLPPAPPRHRGPIPEACRLSARPNSLTRLPHGPGRRRNSSRAVSWAAVWAVALVLVGPSPAHAWGFDVHRFIMDRAIALLPDGLRPPFVAHRAMVVERAIDPDTWITTGGFDEEAPRHFLNLDSPGYGPYPFDGLPREYEQAVARFGEGRVRRNGTLPWRADEFFARLRDAFKAAPGRGLPGSLDALRVAAALSHYVGDAHVPFHAVTNYDGQLTGQRGIHARFETTLFGRFEERLTIAPRPMRPIGDARAYVFDALLEGSRLAPAILAADRDSRRRGYDDPYYAAFFERTRPILEHRLNESIASTAALITGAWEAAGKPALRSPR